MTVASSLSEKILIDAYKLKATDIHFYPYQKHVDIYFRLDGIRSLYKTITASHYRILLAYYKFSSGMDIGQIRYPRFVGIVVGRFIRGCLLRVTQK